MIFPYCNSKNFFGDKALQITTNVSHDEDGFIIIDINSNYNDLDRNIINSTSLITSVSCAATYFDTNSFESQVKIDIGELMGLVRIETQLVINDTCSVLIDNCLDDFYNNLYSLEKGAILTNLPTTTFNVDQEDFSADNLVDIYVAENQKDSMVIRFDSDVISIHLNNKDIYNMYSRFHNQNKNLGWSLLPSSAIISALSSLKEEAADNYKWVNVLLAELGCDISDISNMSTKQLYELCQNKLGLYDYLRRGLLDYSN